MDDDNAYTRPGCCQCRYYYYLSDTDCDYDLESEKDENASEDTSQRLTHKHTRTNDGMGNIGVMRFPFDHATSTKEIFNIYFYFYVISPRRIFRYVFSTLLFLLLFSLVCLTLAVVRFDI